MRILILAALPIPLCSFTQRKANLESELLRLLPKQGELSGVRPASEPQFFEPDDLYKYIDGAADIYLLYGFRKVVTTGYAIEPGSGTITVEIYCMESPTHAFGIYAAERTPEEAPVAIGVQGYLNADALNFYKGPYYVKMVSFAPQDVSATLARIGRSIADKIPGKFREPEIFQYLPAENRVKQSERYIPQDFLGQSYIENGYLCDYATSQGKHHAFVVPLESAAAAQSVLKKYRAFLESRDYKVAERGDNHTVIAEKDGFTLAFTSRSYFGGVLNIKNQKQGQAAIETMIKRLPK